MDSVRILAFVCSASSRKCCPNLGSNQERGSKMTNITARLELLEARVWALEGMVDRLNTTASLRHEVRRIVFAGQAGISAHALGFGQGCASRSGRAAFRCYCRHPNLARAAPPLRPDMIFGKDRHNGRGDRGTRNRFWLIGWDFDYGFGQSIFSMTKAIVGSRRSAVSSPKFNACTIASRTRPASGWTDFCRNSRASSNNVRDALVRILPTVLTARSGPPMNSGSASNIRGLNAGRSSSVKLNCPSTEAASRRS